MLKKVLFFLLLWINISDGYASSLCGSYDFLKNGFDWTSYKTCQTKIHQCPANGPLPNAACVEKTVHENISCGQMKQFSQITGGDISVLQAESADDFIILGQLFPADGQENYYVISPKGCLVNTNTDPRKLSITLQNQYKNAEWVMVNWGKPLFELNPDGTHRFTVFIKVTDTCLACPVVGWAKIEWDFTKDGKLIGANVKDFSKNPPK